MDRANISSISSKKPEAIPGKSRPIPQITWNNMAEVKLRENGFWQDTNVENIYFEGGTKMYTEEKRFLSEVDIRQGPILRQVTHIFRLTARDWSSEKMQRKEYVYYRERWDGKNWLGVKIAPIVSHHVGVYDYWPQELKYDSRTGEPLHYKPGRKQQIYTIPFSKKIVDKILSGYYSDPQDHVRYITSPETVNFIVKFDSADSPPGQSRAGTRGEFSYEQFANWTFKDLYQLHTKPWILTDPNYAPNMSSYK